MRWLARKRPSRSFGAEDADIAANRISVLTPIGMALIIDRARERSIDGTRRWGDVKRLTVLTNNLPPDASHAKRVRGDWSEAVRRFLAVREQEFEECRKGLWDHGSRCTPPVQSASGRDYWSRAIASGHSGGGERPR